MEPSQVVDAIQRNRFNDFTTTYYLLFKRKERAAIFRQQYNEEVKKLLKNKGRNNDKAISIKVSNEVNILKEQPLELDDKVVQVANVNKTAIKKPVQTIPVEMFTPAN